MSREQKIINAFNAGDNLRKFTELVTTYELLNEDGAKEVFSKLDKQFCELGAYSFLRESATPRQAELLKANGELWTHRNMFNTLNALREQKELSNDFEWLKEK